MRTLTLSTLTLLALSTAMAADLDVRHIYITNDVTAARSVVAPLRWYQGESVVVDLWAVRGTNPVDLTGAGMTVRWDAVGQTATNTAYIATTGTIVSAAAGHVRFALAPEYTSMPAGTYRSFIRAYQGTALVGTLHAGEAQVSFAAALGITYAGPWSNVVTVLPANVLTTNLLDPVTLAMQGGLLTVLPGASTEDATARAAIATHTGRVDNPHAVTAAQVGADAIGTASAATGAVATALRSDISAATNANYASLTNWVTAQGYGSGGGITQLVATADAAGVPSEITDAVWGIGTNTTGLGGGGTPLPSSFTNPAYNAIYEDTNYLVVAHANPGAGPNMSGTYTWVEELGTYSLGTYIVEVNGVVDNVTMASWTGTGYTGVFTADGSPAEGTLTVHYEYHNHATHLSTTPAATIIAGAARGAMALTNLTADAIAAGGGLTNIIVNSVTGTVSAGVASVTIEAGGGAGGWVGTATNALFLGPWPLIMTGGGKTNSLTFDGTNFISTITP